MAPKPRPILNVERTDYDEAGGFGLYDIYRVETEPKTPGNNWVDFPVEPLYTTSTTDDEPTVGSSDTLSDTDEKEI